MADTKIASLTDGTSTSATDRIPVAISPYGSGNNAYITPAYLKTFMVTGGTVTTSTPVFDMTQTWNAGAQAFTGLKLNVTDTASASSSMLFDAQADSVSQFYVRKNGVVVATGRFEGGGNPTTPGSVLGDNVSMMSTATLGWTSTSSALNTVDTVLRRDAANTLALQNGTNAQGLYVYNTWSSAGANYERAGHYWSAGAYYMTTSAGGTGSSRGMVITASGNLYLGGGGAAEWQINSSGHFIAQADNTYDIGASGANRPRNIFLANNLTVGAFAGFGATPSNAQVIALAAATTSKAAINFASGVAPTSPNNGDFWFDGTDFKARVGGVTKTFTLV